MTFNPDLPAQTVDGTPVTVRRSSYASEGSRSALLVTFPKSHALCAGGTRHYRIDGTRDNGFFSSEPGPALMNVPEAPVASVDPSKPLQLSNGTPVTLSNNHGWALAVNIPGDRTPRDFYPDGRRCYETGSDRYVGLRLQNAPEAPAVTRSVDFLQPIEMVDGTPAEFVGELANGLFVVRVKPVDFLAAPFLMTVDATGNENPPRTTRGGTTIVSNNGVRNKVVDTLQFFNVYGDGTMGKTAHRTIEDAQDRAKVGKVRVGIVEMLLENGVVAASRYHALKPQTRTSGTSRAPCAGQSGFNTNRFALAV